MPNFIINLLIVISAVLLFWSSSVKVALNSLSWGRLRKLDSKDRHFEKKVGGWIEKRESLVLVLDVISIFLLIFITTLFARHIFVCSNVSADTVLRELVVIVIITIAFTFFSSLLSFKLRNSNCWKLLNFSVPVLSILTILLYPLVIFVRILSERVKTENADLELSSVEDEILAMVEQDAHSEEESSQSGLEADERKMIRGIFDLDNTLVREIMTPRVDINGVEVETEISDVKIKIIESGHSRLPVYRDSMDDIIGIVYAKDLLDDTKIAGKKLVDIIHKPPYIPESKNIGDLLDDLRLNKQHMAVIIDEYGGTSGVVTIEDILEEIVGDIQDEFDTDEDVKPHVFDADGSIVLDGRFYIDEFNELLNGSIEEDENFDTLAGFITDQIGRIPSTGEEFDLDNFKFEIIEADDRRIIKVKVSRTT